MYPLKQSTAITIPFFAFDSNGDPVTGIADASWTKRISKNGGAFSAMTVTITEMEGGFYSLPLSTSHTDTLGILTIRLTAASVKQVNLQFRVQANLEDDPVTVGSMNANTITAAAISNNAITADKIADGAIDAATFAAGAINASAIAADALTSAKIADGAITSGKIADNAITSAKLADNAITSAKIATNAIGADEFSQAAADKVWGSTTRSLTEDVGITQAGADKVWTSATRTLTSFGTLISDIWNHSTRTLTSFGTLIADIWGHSTRTLTSFGTLISDIWNHSSRTLTSFGTLVSDIWGHSSRTLTSFSTTLAQAVWDVLESAITTASSIGVKVKTALPSSPPAGAGGLPTVDGNNRIAGIQGTKTTFDALNDISAAQVNAEVLDVFTVDTFPEPSAVPAATSTLKDKITWLFTLARNKITQTNTTQTLRNDADTGTISTAAVSDDGTTATRAKWQ